MMIATVKMIGFSGHIEISQDSVPLIDRALRDRLGTMHGPFVGITMMGPGADQVFAMSVLGTGGHLYVVWNGKPGGGTGDVVQYERDVGKPVVRIWPQGVSRVVWRLQRRCASAV